jgi:outer membrane receptor for ferrienterochelin and colicin
MPGVGITIKGKTTGTATNSSGKYALTTTEKTPFTIVVTYVGYTPIEREVIATGTNIDFQLESATILGQEVVVSASRTPERILESPVSIERMGQATLRELPVPSFYDALTNMKGVEVSAQALTRMAIPVLINMLMEWITRLPV